MDVSLCIIGFSSKENSIYKKHAAVLQACISAEIKELPEETALYFGSSFPELCLLNDFLEIEIPMTEYNNMQESGYEIKISDIPRDVDIIRIYNSY